VDTWPPPDGLLVADLREMSGGQTWAGSTLGSMINHARYEEVDVIRPADDLHADVAGMMREVREEVEATTLGDIEQIVSIEPWGVESRVFPRTDGTALPPRLETLDVYSYRVTIDSLPTGGPIESGR
jgi:hypothetical protein